MNKENLEVTCQQVEKFKDLISNANGFFHCATHKMIPSNDQFWSRVPFENQKSTPTLTQGMTKLKFTIIRLWGLGK